VTPPPTTAGVPFGRYLIRRRLARGGMGEVFLADQLGPLGPVRPVALKRMLPRVARDPRAATMFLEEMAIAAQLNHPNVATTYDFGEVDGVYFLAMEYVEGLTLRQLVESLGPLPVGEGLGIAAEIAGALEYAHGRRAPGGSQAPVVHRDVSPHNVMISTSGAVKLLDFGIARAETAVLGGRVDGKLAYAAPEQLAGAPADRRADLWALGVVIYELLSGVVPFTAADPVAMLDATRAGRPVPLGARRPEAARAEAIVARAMLSDPEARWPSAEALGSACRALATTLGAHGPEGRARLVLRAGGARAVDASIGARVIGATGTGMGVELEPQPVRPFEFNSFSSATELQTEASPPDPAGPPDAETSASGGWLEHPTAAGPRPWPAPIDTLPVGGADVVQPRLRPAPSWPEPSARRGGQVPAPSTVDDAARTLPAPASDSPRRDLDVLGARLARPAGAALGQLAPAPIESSGTSGATPPPGRTLATAEGEHTVPLVRVEAAAAPPPRRRLALIVAALALPLVALAVTLGTRDTARGSSSSGDERPPLAAAPPSATPPTAARAQTPADTDAPPTSSVAATSTTPGGAGHIATAVGTLAPLPSEAATSPDATPALRRETTERTTARSARPRPRATPARERRREPTPTEAPAGLGLLSVRTVPWSRVVVDGRELGQSPLVHAPTAAGPHMLTLTPGEGAAPPRTVTVNIRAGEVTRVFVDFAKDTVRVEP
jgi:hypothetical protein